MGAAQIIGLILANAPAAIQTVGQIRALFEEGYSEVVAAVGEEGTREQVLALMDQIAAKSTEIQATD
jgi:hypothetical protein